MTLRKITFNNNLRYASKADSLPNENIPNEMMSSKPMTASLHGKQKKTFTEEQEVPLKHNGRRI